MYAYAFIYVTFHYALKACAHFYVYMRAVTSGHSETCIPLFPNLLPQGWTPSLPLMPQHNVSVDVRVSSVQTWVGISTGYIPRHRNAKSLVK